jgi:MFS family permease
MKKINIRTLHPIVWALLLGTVFARGASYMAMPFLALHLSHSEGINPVLIGAIIGVGPLMGTIGGFLGGNLSDRYGRKVIMLSSIFVWSLVFFGFAAASSPLVFFLLNALNGICRSFFEPASQALMADVTEKDKRLRVFSLRYTAINIGAAAGPLLGAYFGMKSAGMTFDITGTFYLVYGIAIAILLGKYKVRNAVTAKGRTAIKEAFRIIGRDKALRLFILGGILVNVGYSQNDSSLPQHLGQLLKDGVVLYSVLLSVNAVAVVILQIPLSRLVEKWKVLHVMVLGSVFFTAGYIGFGLSLGWAGFIISMLIVTIGEIFLFPSTSVFIDQIAPEELRGTYFGAAQFRSIGNSAGPIMGGLLLRSVHGHWLFCIMAFLVGASSYFFIAGNRLQSDQAVPQAALTENSVKG